MIKFNQENKTILWNDIIFTILNPVDEFKFIGDIGQITVEEDKSILIYEDNNKINFIFNNLSNNSVKLKINSEYNFHIENGKLINGSSQYEIETNNIELKVLNGDILSSDIIDISAELIFSSLSSGGFKSLSVGDHWVISEDNKIPRFKIRIYDYYSYTQDKFFRARPQVNNIQIISTVPSEGKWSENKYEDLSLKEKSDISIINYNEIPSKNKIFFEIKSSIEIPTQYSPTLLIYEPSGIDTTKLQPTKLQTTRINNTTFLVEKEVERQNYTERVDGIAYLSISIPIKSYNELELVVEV